MTYPEDTLTYLANVFNQKARDFYAKHGVKVIAAAYEAQEELGEVSLMITKHCVRFSMSLCPKQAKGVTGVQGTVKAEPLQLINGKEKLTLRFDCKPCEMHVVGKIKKSVLNAVPESPVQFAWRTVGQVSASAHPLAGVLPHAHPWAGGADVATFAQVGPAHLHIAEHAFGVRHHGRETPIGRGHGREAPSAAVGVEGVLLGGLTVVVHKAHGRNGLGRIATVLEIGKALAVRHSDRQAAACHALQEQAG